MTMNDTPTPLTIKEVDRRACGMLEKNPQLLSLLYDMDLMPEQLEVGSMNWRRMVMLCERWSGLQSELTALRALAENMASACETTYSAIEWPADGTSDVEIAAAEYRTAYPKP